MIFRELRIVRGRWGADEGKITATLEIEGRSAKLTLEIGEPASQRIMEACADIVAEAGAEQAAAFRQEFLDAVRNPVAPGEGGVP